LENVNGAAPEVFAPVARITSPDEWVLDKLRAVPEPVMLHVIPVEALPPDAAEFTRMPAVLAEVLSMSTVMPF
jgi:hypothetical protein